MPPGGSEERPDTCAPSSCNESVPRDRHELAAVFPGRSSTALRPALPRGRLPRLPIRSEIARMTENYDPPAPAPVVTDPSAVPADGPQGTVDIAKGQAAELGRSGAEAGKHAVDIAREQA